MTAPPARLGVPNPFYLMKKQLTAFIAEHLNETVDAQAVPAGTCCAFSGEPLTKGIKLSEVIKPATSNIADTFKVPSGFVSVPVAQCFQASRKLRGNLFVDAKGIQHPMISAKSAKAKNRPVWRDLIRNYFDAPHPRY